MVSKSYAGCLASRVRNVLVGVVFVRGVVGSFMSCILTLTLGLALVVIRALFLSPAREWPERIHLGNGCGAARCGCLGDGKITYSHPPIIGCDRRVA